MTDSAQYRVRYHAGQTLRRQDFEDEQSYHSGQLQSHNRYQHRPGVLEGLNICFDKAEMRFKVQDGKAIGKDGTFIVLDKIWPIEISNFDEKGRDRLDVYLEHSDLLDTQDSLPKHYTRCRIPQDETDSRRAIKVGVAVEELRAKPQRADAIYLGRLIRDFSSAEVGYIADMRERENAGLVGAVISSPSGKARIELGTYERTDDRRFAVFLADPSDSSTCSHQTSQNARNQDSAALEIRAADEHYAIDLRGKATVTGDLFVRQGALAFQGHANTAKDNSDAATKVAEWLYQEPDLKVSEALRKLKELVEPATSAAQAGGGSGVNVAGDEQPSQLDREWIEELLRSRAFRTLGELLQELAAILPLSTANAGESSASSVPEDAQRIPRPWTVYRAQGPLDLVSGGRDEIPQVPTEQLRVELSAERDSAFVVGSLPADGEQFEPILTVRSRPANGNETLGQVVVKGDLIIEGRIEGKREEPILSDQARELLFSGALLGPQNAEALIEAFERTGFLPELKALNKLQDDVQVLQQVAKAILGKANGAAAIGLSIAELTTPNQDPVPAATLKPIVDGVLEQDNGASAVGDSIQALTEPVSAAMLQPIAEELLKKDNGAQSVANGIADAVNADAAATVLEPVVEEILKKTNGAQSVANGIADAVNADAAATVLEPVVEEILKKTNGAQSVANGIADAVNADAAATVLEPVVEEILKKTNGAQSVANGIADAVNADAAATVLQPVVEEILKKTNGAQSVANGIADAVNADAAATVLQPVVEEILKKTNGAQSVANGIADAVNADAAATVLEPVVEEILKKTNGAQSVANGIADAVNADAAATVLEPVVEEILKKTNGAQSVANGIADAVNADAAATVLEPVVEEILKKTNGAQSVANGIADAVNADAAATVLEPVVEEILKKTNGAQSVANGIADAVNADAAATVLEPVVEEILKKTNGAQSVANGIADAVNADAAATVLQPVVEEILKKTNGAQSVANGIADAFQSDVNASRLKPIAEELLKKTNGPEAVVSTSGRRRAVIRGLIDKFRVETTTVLSHPGPVNTLAGEIVTEDATTDKIWATSLRDELTLELSQ